MILYEISSLNQLCQKFYFQRSAIIVIQINPKSIYQQFFHSFLRYNYFSPKSQKLFNYLIFNINGLIILTLNINWLFKHILPKITKNWLMPLIKFSWWSPCSLPHLLPIDNTSSKFWPVSITADLCKYFILDKFLWCFTSCWRGVEEFVYTSHGVLGAWLASYGVIWVFGVSTNFCFSSHWMCLMMHLECFTFYPFKIFHHPHHWFVNLP